MSKIKVMMTLFLLSGCNLKMSSPVPLATAPQNQTEAVQINTLNVGFEAIKLSSAATCIKCHAAGRQKPELSDLATFRDHQDDILDEVTQNSMPPKEKGYSPLTTCYRALLLKWFDLGAPENSEIKIISLDECKDLKN